MNMLLELDCTTTFKVIESWDRLKKIPNYEAVAGEILFQRLFLKCPPAGALFGFPINVNPTSERLLESKCFQIHATYMIEMLDKAMNLLGPDVELLGDILADLGKKHAKFGVKEEYFTFMGEALNETLRETLKHEYTSEDEEAMVKVYLALSTEMCNSMTAEMLVLKSWEKLKEIDNYKEIVGSKLLQSFFQKCPTAKSLFGFPIDMDPRSDELTDSKRFKMHSEIFIGMVESALNMIEKEKLDENLPSLGKTHSNYGVKAEYFPLMGESLIGALRRILKKDFSSDTENAWKEVYRILSRKIVKSMSLVDIVTSKQKQ